MESLQNIKKRLKSINNINQITKAMELVAVTKMRKSQEIALSSMPYALSALNLLANVSKLEIDLPPLLKKRTINKTLFVLVSSDKGLAGAFNSSLFRKFESHFGKEDIKDDSKFLFLAVGEKSFNYLERKGLKVIEKFVRVGNFTTPEETNVLAEFLANGYLEKKWDKVIVFSTHFKSVLKQDPLMRDILPIDFENIKKAAKDVIPESGKFADTIKERSIDFSLSEEKEQSYAIEPSPTKVLEKLVWHLFLMQVYHLILEANASEHAARRLAMKTASDNASELFDELTLQYNKSRQSSITKEIIEIVAGAKALN